MKDQLSVIFIGGLSNGKIIYDYLNSHEDDDKFRYTMVGYKLCNTVTENGYISRSSSHHIG